VCLTACHLHCTPCSALKQLLTIPAFLSCAYDRPLKLMVALDEGGDAWITHMRAHRYTTHTTQTHTCLRARRAPPCTSRHLIPPLAHKACQKAKALCAYAARLAHCQVQAARGGRGPHRLGLGLPQVPAGSEPGKVGVKGPPLLTQAAYHIFNHRHCSCHDGSHAWR